MADSEQVLGAHECIGVEPALRAVTLDAAWQCRPDDVTGSIEVGKYADLVLLEDDPTCVEPTSISGVAVNQTWLAGQVQFSAHAT